MCAILKYICNSITYDMQKEERLKNDNENINQRIQFYNVRPRIY